MLKRLHLPSFKQAREFGLIMQKDDSIRAIYNHNEKHQYYGRLHREQPADAQLRCAQPSV